MKTRLGKRTILGCGLAIATCATFGMVATAQTPLAIDSARITISGTSNVHPYTASTTAVRVTRAEIMNAVAGPEFWSHALKPGAGQVVEITVLAATLTSPKDGLDKNMHKALKVQEHPDITFRLLRFEAGAVGTVKAIGTLRIAGVEREIALDLKTQRKDSTLTVTGEIPILMTDYGIVPPKAMLGMLKTDPKVTVGIEAVLMVPLT
jgi:hypothetical protein